MANRVFTIPSVGKRVVAGQEAEPSNRPPFFTLKEVLGFLSPHYYRGILVGKCVFSPLVKRLEVQVRPLTRKHNAVGETSTMVRECINRFFPFAEEVKEHSLVVRCIDSRGAVREVLVQEGDLQERLEMNNQVSTFKGRSYSTTFRGSVVGSIEDTKILVCQLDDPNFEEGGAAKDLQPDRIKQLASSMGGSPSQKKDSSQAEGVAEETHGVGSMTVAEKKKQDTVRKRMESQTLLRAAKAMRRDQAKRGFHQD